MKQAQVVVPTVFPSAAEGRAAAIIGVVMIFHVDETDSRTPLCNGRCSGAGLVHRCFKSHALRTRPDPAH